MEFYSLFDHRFSVQSFLLNRESFFEVETCKTTGFNAAETFFFPFSVWLAGTSHK
jgi:hypothetical protein